MILDARGQLASAQTALTSGVSDHWIDAGPILRDLGTGKTMWFDFHITTSYTVAAPGTDKNNIVFAIVLVDDSGTLITVSTAGTVHWNIGEELAGPTAVAGDHIYVPLSMLSTGMVRYLKTAAGIGAPLRRIRALHTVVNTAGDGFATGAYSCTLLADPPSRVLVSDYANAI